MYQGLSRNDIFFRLYRTAVDLANISDTIKLHKRGSLLLSAGHPFPLLLGQPSSALLYTAQAGGPPAVKIGWATKTIIVEDV